MKPTSEAKKKGTGTFFADGAKKRGRGPFSSQCFGFPMAAIGGLRTIFRRVFSSSRICQSSMVETASSRCCSDRRTRRADFQGQDQPARAVLHGKSYGKSELKIRIPQLLNPKYHSKKVPVPFFLIDAASASRSNRVVRTSKPTCKAASSGRAGVAAQNSRGQRDQWSRLYR
jgi:hypothetical protein